MSHPDDAARLREIKRLLERVQRLPQLVATPANGPMDRLDTAHRVGAANGFRVGPVGGCAGGQVGGRADWDTGVRLADEEDSGRLAALRPVGEAARAPEPQRAGPPPLDPLPRAFDPADEDDARGDFWAAEPADRSRADTRALVPARTTGGGVPGISPWLFIAATAVNTVLAAALAVGITLGLARREPEPAPPAKAALAVKPAEEGRLDPAVLRPLELLSVGSAGEPLRLEALKPARLPLAVRPVEAAEDSYTLVLTGLPANATLSGAIPMGTNTWHLPPGALQQLEIVVPEWSTAVFEVGVELRRTNGTVAGQAKLWLAVPPPPPPAGASLDAAALKDAIGEGDKLLSRGDVVAARAMYERAAAMGSAPAALAMGATYDTPRLWALGVFGMVGSKERARQWYQRADELGHPEAKARLKALQ